MGSINFAAPFALLHPIESDPAKYATEYANLAGLAQERQVRQQQMAASQQQMAASQQEMALTGTKLQQAQQTLQDQQTIRTRLPQLMADPQYQTPEGQFDWNKGLNQIASEGNISPDTITTIQTHLENLSKAHAEADKFHQDAAHAQAQAADLTRKGQEAVNDSLANFALDLKEKGGNPAALDTALAWFEDNHAASRPAVDKVRANIAADPAHAAAFLDQLGSGLSQEGLKARAEAKETTTKAQKAGIDLDQAKLAQGVQMLQTLPRDPASGLPAAEPWAAVRQAYPGLQLPEKPDQATIERLTRAMVAPEKQPEYDLNAMKARMGLMGNSEYDQFLAQYAKSLGGKTPAQLTPQEGLQSFQEFAKTKRDPVMEGMAVAMKQASLDNMAFQQGQRSYQFHAGELDKLAKPVMDTAQRLGRLEDAVAQNTPQADALIAPELLSVMAGGSGSGLRMNEAEISRMVGGRSKWEDLKAAVNKWSLDPSKAASITPEQRQEIRTLVGAVRTRMDAKQGLVNTARQDLAGSNDPMQHRTIISNLNQGLSAIDTPSPSQGGAGTKTATTAQVAAYAKRKGIDQGQAIQEFKASGYTIQ